MRPVSSPKVSSSGYCSKRALKVVAKDQAAIHHLLSKLWSNRLHRGRIVPAAGVQSTSKQGPQRFS